MPIGQTQLIVQKKGGLVYRISVFVLTEPIYRIEHVHRPTIMSV